MDGITYLSKSLLGDSSAELVLVFKVVAGVAAELTVGVELEAGVSLLPLGMAEVM